MLFGFATTLGEPLLATSLLAGSQTSALSEGVRRDVASRVSAGSVAELGELPKEVGSCWPEQIMDSA